MIDATKFASAYNAFWSEMTPTLDLYVRRLNLEYSRREYAPIQDSLTGRRAILAEYAFSLFHEAWRVNGHSVLNLTIEDAAWLETRRRMTPFLGQIVDFDNPLDIDERKEVVELVRRLRGLFSGRLHPNRVRPIFRGCGFIDASEGDIISDQTLFEVKTVDRSFRSIDIRQLISYAALNHSSKQFDIQYIGLFNPRWGIVFRMPIDEACKELSGQSAEELLSLIVHAFSSGDSSR